MLFRSKHWKQNIRRWNIPMLVNQLIGLHQRVMHLVLLRLVSHIRSVRKIAGNIATLLQLMVYRRRRAVVLVAILMAHGRL